MAAAMAAAPDSGLIRSPADNLTTTDGDVEVDLPLLRQRLDALGRQVIDAQARVGAKVEAKHAEFVAAAGQIQGLRDTVARVRGDANALAAVVRDGCDSSGGTSVASLRMAAEEHVKLVDELSAIEVASTVLAAVLAARQRLAAVDQSLVTGRYEDAVVAALEVARRLQDVSAPTSMGEPAIVRAVKAQYYQRRAQLATGLEDALGRLVRLGDRCTIAVQAVAASGKGAHGGAVPATLRQVWTALDALGLRADRLERLADDATRAVLRPLLEAGRRVPAGHQLRADIVESPDGERTWRWYSESNHPSQANGGKGTSEQHQKPGVSIVLPAVESFLIFIGEAWTGDLPEVRLVLGRRLFSQAARAMLQYFDACGLDGGEALERFEGTLRAKGLISPKETILTTHVYEHRRAMGQQRLASALTEARAVILELDAGGGADLVAVSDAEQRASATRELQQQRHQVHSSSSVGADAIGTALRGALANCDGFLQLPSMHVSAAAAELAKRLRSIVAEAALAEQNGQAEAVLDLVRIAREIITLFIVLRPYAQRVQLRGSPRCGATFLADCLYLAHVLTLACCSCNQNLPNDRRHVAALLDLVPQLRRIGEYHFLALLRHQQEQIVAALRPLDPDAGPMHDHRFVAAEAALGAAAQQTKLAAQGLAASLPKQLLREITGVLLGFFCQSILACVLRPRSMEPEEICLYSRLLSQALNLGRQVFTTVDLDIDSVAMASVVPYWHALEVVTDLMGSDLPRFLGKCTEVSTALSRDETIRLMQLSRIEDPEDSWDTLQAACEVAGARRDRNLAH
eukprot:TRINITY_DN18347_c0_g1_i1.p1 TRINITY_DN18347_c0_g1~~TRINITY_DN18347_c0_g1_i1.p1  ORF type:complete len:803 (+),score=124.79 TRINITY_DN18347_c0_g1_i1:71-2479(+)